MYLDNFRKFENPEEEETERGRSGCDIWIPHLIECNYIGPLNKTLFVVDDDVK